MNVIKSLTLSIEDDRKENKNPCKNYATEEAAERATAAMAQTAAYHFMRNDYKGELVPARYVVFYIAAWDRWVGCIDLTELMQRSSSAGGYIGICKGFYTY